MLDSVVRQVIIIVIILIVDSLTQVDLNPGAFFLLLNFELQIFEPWQFLHASDIALVGLLAAIAENSLDDRTADLARTPPHDHHDDEHDQVKQSQLQNNEEHVKEQRQYNREDRPQADAEEDTLLAIGGVVRGRERLVHALEFVPLLLLANVVLPQLIDVLLVHFKRGSLRIPN